jgi:beta-lactamase class A
MLASTTLTPKPVDKYSPLIISLNEYLSSKKGHYGIYFVSLTTGKEFGINATEDYTAASTIKVPINLYAFKLIAEGKVNPEEELTYTKEDYEEGTGNLQYENFGNQYSIRTLCNLSIKTSDNVAINMLIRHFNIKNIKNFEATLVKHPIDLYKNISCPKDMAIYFKNLLEFKKQYPKEGNEFISYLENTIFSDRIPKLLPSNVLIAHKIGNQFGCIHDVGIIFAKKPFILSIMSKNIENSDDDNCEAYKVIPQISKMIYDFEENNH